MNEAPFLQNNFQISVTSRNCTIFQILENCVIAADIQTKSKGWFHQHTN